jgi:hypothetical protein
MGLSEKKKGPQAKLGLLLELANRWARDRDGFRSEGDPVSGVRQRIGEPYFIDGVRVKIGRDTIAGFPRAAFLVIDEVVNARRSGRVSSVIGFVGGAVMNTEQLSQVRPESREAARMI